jgi:hypothetical protein
MKTKPLVLVALVLTAVAVSAGAGLVIGRLGARLNGMTATGDRAGVARAVVAGVAKAAVHVLACR